MNARRNELVHGFIDAMTCGLSSGSRGGNRSSSSRPIELHAHDPPRYVGDMLAWVHQAVPNEKETAHSLLSLCQNISKFDILSVLTTKYFATLNHLLISQDAQ